MDSRFGEYNIRIPDLQHCLHVNKIHRMCLFYLMADYIFIQRIFRQIVGEGKTIQCHITKYKQKRGKIHLFYMYKYICLFNFSERYIVTTSKVIGMAIISSAKRILSTFYFIKFFIEKSFFLYASYLKHLFIQIKRYKCLSHRIGLIHV